MALQRWNIDPSHSSVTFSVRHMVISKVRGAFERYRGTVDFDEQTPAASRIAVEIDADSIQTHEAKRDAHLRSPDFFDVVAFPKLTFESTKVEKGGDGYLVTGQLGVHGVTKEVVLNVEALGGGKDPWGQQRIGFQAKTSLNRKDYGLSWNQALEAGGVLVGEKIEIELDIQGIAATA